MWVVSFATRLHFEEENRSFCRQINSLRRTSCFVFCRFFTRMNNQLFHVLHDAATSEDRTLTEDHFNAMGLDPSVDRHFVMDLLELYAIDLLLVVDNPCCPI